MGVTDSKTRADESETNTTEYALGKARLSEMAMNRPMLTEAPRSGRATRGQDENSRQQDYMHRILSQTRHLQHHLSLLPFLRPLDTSRTQCQSQLDARRRRFAQLRPQTHDTPHADVAGQAQFDPRVGKDSTLCMDQASGRSPRALRMIRFEFEAPTACKRVKSYWTLYILHETG